MNERGKPVYVTVEVPPSTWNQARAMLGLLVGVFLGIALARQDLSAGEYADMGALTLTYVTAIVAGALSWAYAPALISVGVGAVISAVSWELVVPLMDRGRPLIGGSFSHFGIIAGSAYLAAGLVVVVRHHTYGIDDIVPKLSLAQRALAAGLGLVAGLVAARVGFLDFGTVTQGSFVFTHVSATLTQAAVIMLVATVLLAAAIRHSRIGAGMMAVALVLAVAWLSAGQMEKVPDDVVWPALACAVVIVSAVMSLRSEESYVAPVATLQVNPAE